MTSDEEHRCATEYVATGSPALAARLIKANMRLVVKIAMDYRRTHCDLRDLIQEGNLGLVHAVGRFDPTRGVKLCSYAAWWIRAYILKSILDNWRLVKTGTTQAQRKLFFGLRREVNRLERKGIVEPDVTSLATALAVKERDVEQMLERFAGGEASLDAPRSAQDAGGTPIGASLSAAPDTRPDVRVETVDFTWRLQSKLETFAATLAGREAAIFRRRLLTDEPETLAQLAVDFGVTRERTRQLEKRLKGRLRDYLGNQLGNAVSERLAS